jgi:hypothetical protein
MKLPKSTTQFGKVGDMIVSCNRAGPYARLWVKPLDPQTPRQLAHRARTTVIGTSWRRLTDAQQLRWRAFGEDLGIKVNPGFNAYASVNHVRLFLGEPLLVVPPERAAFELFKVTGLQATLLNGELHVALQGLSDPTPDIRYVVEATAPGSAGRRRRKSDLVFLDRPATLADLRDPVALGRAYVQRHHLPAAGQRVTFRVSQILNYQWGGCHMLDAVVTRAESPGRS